MLYDLAVVAKAFRGIPPKSTFALCNQNSLYANILLSLQEITTIYGVDAPLASLPSYETAIIKQERDEKDEDFQVSVVIWTRSKSSLTRDPQHKYLQNLKDTLKDEKLWLAQESKFLNREDNLIKGMDVRSPDYQRRKAALQARRARYATRCQLQGVRRQQIISGNARGDINAHANVLADSKVDKQLKKRRQRQNNSSVSSFASRNTSVQQQRLPTVCKTFQPPVVPQDCSSAPLFPPPPSNLAGAVDYSSALWTPPPPPPPPSSAFRPYQPGLFNFDKFIPSYSRMLGPENSAAKYIEPPKSFTFPATLSHDRLDQAGSAMHPARLALLEQADEPEFDAVIFKTEGDIHFPSSSFWLGNGNALERTGANIEPLTRKRPSPQKDEEPLSQERDSPSKLRAWVVEPNVTPEKFRPAPSILHGYGHSYV